MLTSEIFEILHIIVGDIRDHYEDAHFEMRRIGQRQYASELRVWIQVHGAHPDLMVQVWGVDEFFWSVTNLRTGRDVALSARRPDAATRYSGRGWRDRLRGDVLKALFEAIESLE